MVEETLSNTTPKVSGQSRPSNLTQAPADRQTAARKSTGSRTAAQPVGRQQRLMIHLFIGFLMAGIAMAGYTFFGSGASASAANTAGHRLTDVTTNGIATEIQTKAGVSIPQSSPAQMSAMPGDITTSDMTALHAEMAEITRRMNALNAKNYPVRLSPSTGAAPGLAGNGGSTAYNGTSVNNPDQIQSTLEQMMSMTHDMMAMIDNIGGQTSGMGSQTSGTGHLGHH